MIRVAPASTTSISFSPGRHLGRHKNPINVLSACVQWRLQSPEHILITTASDCSTWVCQERGDQRLETHVMCDIVLIKNNGEISSWADCGGVEIAHVAILAILMKYSIFVFDRWRSVGRWANFGEDTPRPAWWDGGILYNITHIARIHDLRRGGGDTKY